MSLNNTPSSERIHIGIFGKRNAGKSSIINAITGQNLAIVSDVKGTTTDPVLKTMELLPLGPVVVIDTPGLDDEGELGELRTQKAYQMLNKTDIALVIIDGQIGVDMEDIKIIEAIEKKKIPYIMVYNKADLEGRNIVGNGTDCIWVSATTGRNIEELKRMIVNAVPKEDVGKRLVSDLIEPLDFVVLVVPIDSSAPKGRLILPQQQTIRDILQAGAVSIVVKDTELSETFVKLQVKPSLVITDSQVFEKVAGVVPEDVPLTSFSILMARHKGDLNTVVRGAYALKDLQDGDTILISEGCTHHRQCEDIGTIKLPKWLREYTGKELQFEFTSGTEFPDDLLKYKLIIHCGGCMLNEREMKYRLKCAGDAGVPITNYGIVIAHMKGILKRNLEVFKKSF
ncbi:MAG: [Tyzzerella sp.]|nr:[FeFe] hydrogenase H-cluster maturation GTPase HydF [Tyzzerella sp.]